MNSPKNKRLPKARVMYCDEQYQFEVRAKRLPIWKPNDPQFHCAVIPTPTAAKARQIVKAAPFLTMTEEEQVDVIAAASSAYAETTMGDDQAWNDRLHSLAILAAIKGGAR